MKLWRRVNQRSYLKLVLLFINIAFWGSILIGIVAEAQSLSIPLKQVGDQMGNPTFWKVVTAGMAEDGNGYYVAGGAWLDDSQTSIIAILYQVPAGEGAPVEDLTNAFVGIFDKEGERYKIRQFIDLWDAFRDYNQPERLSLPMQAAWLTNQQSKTGSYYSEHITITAVDLDHDADHDILIELRNGGGSYIHYDLFLLQNSNNIYKLVLSKTGGDGTGSDNLEHVRDLDADGIPEILVWDEIYSDGVPHSDCRSWIDLYHWDRTKMVQCNAAYPTFYTQLKQEFLRICNSYQQMPEIWYRDGKIPDYWGVLDISAGCLPEQIYYLGLIAEYEKDYTQALAYYRYFLREPPVPYYDPYVESAQARILQLRLQLTWKD
jgi:hypothetical protein